MMLPFWCCLRSDIDFQSVAHKLLGLPDKVPGGLKQTGDWFSLRILLQEECVKHVSNFLN